jgi:hypothetical protein
MRVTHGIVVGVLAAAVLGGCHVYREDGEDEGVRQDVAAPMVEEAAAPGETFDSAEAAEGALKDAVAKEDREHLRRIFGPTARELVSGDPVADKRNFEQFSKRVSEETRIEMKGDGSAVVLIGNEEWPFPIPLAKNEQGKWFFDTQAGKSEILARRIGKNELDAIDVMKAYVQAQREYASKDRDGDEVLEYAQRLVSRPGQKDGLYWESGEANDQSPFGPLTAEAGLEGYGPVRGGRRSPTPYHGYVYHVLRAQGSHAPGGAYSYVINGNMIAGFALIASPAEYGQSGVMTFIVNHQGKVYQRDFGARTRTVFETMTAYDPGEGWELVK